MNQVVLKGRLSRDPEIRFTSTNNKKVANFSVAVQRNFKNANGEYDADFFNCVAFAGTADMIEKFFKKGQEILLTGRIQNRSWDDDQGTKHYATDIMVDRVEFCGSKSTNVESKPTTEMNDLQFEASLSNIPSLDKDDSLPF